MNSSGFCKSCGQPIVWCRTDTGKRMPVDPEPSPEGNLVLIAGELPTTRSVSRGGHQPGEPLYVSHFKTCPHASAHRKKTSPKKPLTPPGPVLFEEPR